MTTWKVIRSLGPIDMQNVRRDSLLRWMFAIPLLIAAVLRWGLPWIAGRVAASFGVDITPYYPLMMGLIIQVVPLMFGMVIGFLLLDQRDDRTLTALQVTPLTLPGYLGYRIAVPVLLSVLTTLLVIPLSGLSPLAPGPLLLVAITAAPLAPLFALFLASFAQNKVQGFALQKASGVFMLPPLIAYFVHSPWQWGVGLVPTYWPARLYWALAEGTSPVWLYCAAGLLYQGGLLVLLIRRFNAVMTRTGE